MRLKAMLYVLKVPSGRKYAESRSKVTLGPEEFDTEVKETSKQREINARGISVIMVGQSTAMKTSVILWLEGGPAMQTYSA